MKAWLAALPKWLANGDDCILVTVAHIAGSTPREAGASMLVKLVNAETSVESLSDQAHQIVQTDTIGGGHLEWLASQIAQNMLETTNDNIRLEKFNLGARLGQCCGGLVWVIFEKIFSTQVKVWQQYIDQMKQGSLIRRLTSADMYSNWQLGQQTGQEYGSTKTQLSFRQQDWTFQQTLIEDVFSVVIFGAGHVGQAVVNALLPLQAHIRLVDQREEIFPVHRHPEVEYILTDTPEAEIALASANSYFLIMTHNHALDFSLCMALFKRKDFAYFGLIGSQSKRAVFEHRLKARGVSLSRLPDMICPIGVQGIHSKEPTAIAISVVAQLLQVHSTAQKNLNSVALDLAMGHI